jgi:hypothetical protein
MRFDGQAVDEKVGGWVAAVARFKVRHFNEAIKAKVGAAPHQYLIEQRTRGRDRSIRIAAGFFTASRRRAKSRFALRCSTISVTLVPQDGHPAGWKAPMTGSLDKYLIL